MVWVYDAIIIHYGEIALKGKNRSFFENTLIKNIKKKIDMPIKKYWGYFEIPLKGKEYKENKEKVIKALKTIFGIENFSFCIKTKPDFGKIKEKALEIVKNKNKTFKIKTKRGNKQFPLTSPEINKKLGMYLEKCGQAADIKNPDYILYLDIQQKGAYLYTETYSGLGGLPVGVSGKCTCLFSGGIDSPVAAYYMMKRGCNIILVHFYRTPSIEKKIIDLVDKLKQFDPEIIFVPVNFKKIQDQIIMNISSKYRLLIYRRFMFRLAQKIAEEHKSNCLCTGENLGQVASQTIENLYVASEPVADKIIVLRPLLSFDKKEIIQKAKEINTYKISIQPYEECCSFMAPKHPETRAKLKDILEYEENLDVEGLIKETVS